MSSDLTKNSFMDMWTKELLPSIRKEIKCELQEIRDDIKNLREKCEHIERSQEFLSQKYDKVIESIQESKKKIQANSSKIDRQTESTSYLEANVDEIYTILDELQQYSRRDCLEIQGVPQIENEDLEQLVIEVCDLIGAKVTRDDISIAHRLPDTRKTKDRMIVKFLRRKKKEEVYKCRKQLQKKSIKDLPSIESQPSRSKKSTGKIHINESLTAYRRNLLWKVNEFKKENNFKFLWTNSGKIFLRQNESSEVYMFKTEEEFERFAPG